MKHTTQSLRAAGVRFMHFRNADGNGGFAPQGGITLAFVPICDVDDGTTAYATGYALCREATAESDKADTFNRKLGALIAGGRALARKNDKAVPHSDIVTFPTTFSPKQLEDAMAKDAAVRGYTRSTRKSHK